MRDKINRILDLISDGWSPLSLPVIPWLITGLSLAVLAGIILFM